ncbi:MAG: hypothetical protein E7547_00700 [Ruminococcaceae bacterium]|nr:hypothetical protein [Oscillospiraceae bacterium]
MKENDTQRFEQPAVDLNNADREQAYLNAMRTLEKEKEDAKKAEAEAKKAKKKAKRKKRMKTLGIIVAAFIAFCVLSPTIFSASAKKNINKYISNPDSRTTTLEQLVDEYLEFEESESKEQKTLFKLGKKAISEEEYGAAAYLFKVCSENTDKYDSDIADEISEVDINKVDAEKASGYASLASLGKDKGLTFDEKTNEAIFGFAKQAEANKDYETVMNLYSVYSGTEDVTEGLKNAQYNVAINYIEDELYHLAAEKFKELGNYKYSKHLYLWSSVEAAKGVDNTNTARNELKAKLKDPASYQENSATHTAVGSVREDRLGKQIVVIVYSVRINYSATNSFGGRITDDYLWTQEKQGDLDADGIDEGELKQFLRMHKNKVLETVKA